MHSRLVSLALLLAPSLLFAQADRKPDEPLKARYTKYEYQIPMRDGIKLFTSVYVPKDDSQQYPILLTRTPYSVGPYGVDKYSERSMNAFEKAGYIFVRQDVRGRWMSEGEFDNMRAHIPNKTSKQFDESSDTYDTIEWLLKNLPNHNGKVGQMGISYPGFYTVCGMIDAHPALVAVSPQAPVTDWFVGDDFHHNGCLFLPHCFNFMANFGKPRPEPTKKSQSMPFDHGTPDGYKFFLEMGPLANANKLHLKGEIAFWNEVMKHGTYDEFWKSRNLRAHIKDTKPAVMTVGGWFDAENLFGALETFKKVEATGVPKGGNTLVMGPWVHGGWAGGDGDRLGDVRFHSKTAEYYREQIELPFFEHHLKGKRPLNLPKAWVFETGTNVWRKYDAWPPKDAKPTEFRLSAGGKLVRDGAAADTNDEFVSDPAKPVPYISKTAIGMMQEYMTADQRFAATRPDVLVYQTPVLDKDTTVAGSIEVELSVATTGTDADWVVKLIDVYPDDAPDNEEPTTEPGRRPRPADVRMGGYQQLVRGEPFRGKFRNSFEKPEAFKPGERTTVKFAMPDTLHTFRPGHRMMIQVQSSWFPLVDRNPQTFCDIYTAKETDFKKQTHTVFHSSKIGVRVLEK
jgi:hypothetical protein